MKAKEYYEKYRRLIFEVEDGLKATTANGTAVLVPREEDALNQIAFDVFKEYMEESQKLAEKRKIFKPYGLKSLIEETNDKWNAMCSLFEKAYGETPFRRNGFRSLLLHTEPRFRTLYDEKLSAPRLFELDV